MNYTPTSPFSSSTNSERTVPSYELRWDRAPTLLSSAYVVPGPLTQLEVSVNGVRADGSDYRIHHEYVTKEGWIKWHIPDDVLSVPTITFGQYAFDF